MSLKSLDEFDENGVQTRFAILPPGATESRAERLERWRQMGSFDPDCPTCQRRAEHPTLSYGGPGHRPSRMCRSGARPHCTCDACF